MKKAMYTEAQIRASLHAAIGSGKYTQAQIARECGVSPQNVSAMVKGAPIVGKVLAWLGYRRVEGIYERVS